MNKFDSYQEKKFSGCKCCDNCAKLWNCSDICCDWITIRNSDNTKEFSCISGHKTKRTVSEEQKNELHKRLQEYRKKLTMDKRQLMLVLVLMNRPQLRVNLRTLIMDQLMKILSLSLKIQNKNQYIALKMIHLIQQLPQPHHLLLPTNCQLNISKTLVNHQTNIM